MLPGAPFPPADPEPIAQPVLTTPRLVLRPFEPHDAEAIRLLAGDIDVARNTADIPHPYTLADAESWIASQPSALERRAAVTYAVTLESALIGAVGLMLELSHDRAELGYWIGRPFWGQGFATEAAAAVVDWAFDALRLHRIHARHFRSNPPSGRVLRKLGMRHEGTLREHRRKWGEYMDMECYGLLREDRDARLTG